MLIHPELKSVVFVGILLALLSNATSHVAAAAEDEQKEPMLTVLERTAKPLLKCDRPWEDFCLSFCQILKIDDQWHMWYTACDHNYKDDNDCYFCYAQSKDGIHWEKPSLGIYAYQGSTDNNILGFGIHGVTVFLDKNAPATEQFKAVGVRQPSGSHQWWIYGATSPDGIQWAWLEEPLLKKNSDTANVCIRDSEVYRLYVRMWTEGIFAGKRVVGYTESATFGSFPDPVAVLSPDEDDPADLHFYNAATTKLANDCYLMLPSGFLTGDGTLPVYAALSRDGKKFERLGKTPLLAPGDGFDSKGVYVGPGAIPGEMPGTYWFYYLGVSVPHDANVPAKAHGDGGIGRFLLNVNETSQP
jgi:hypothetical protein